ncbi:Alpha/Beta hydrolase protein [Flagelloscypha sp. PMI_526]|nr:Alpha/Beta hydrolase protein [Flagelloscypha sp. PMI_526]
MPSVKVKTSCGPLNIAYHISTPKSTSAKSIDKNLPCVLFLHPVYIASDIWQNQFNNEALRRFNLISLDLRSHGETGGNVPSHFTRVQAAEDVFKFMDALKLPPCHLVGLSMGACISVQTAVDYPQKVASLTLISPLGMHEPENVGLGRAEIHQYWREAFQNPKNIDKEALADAVFGALELGFNGQKSSIVDALVNRTLPYALKNWGAKNLDDHRILTVDFFVKRKAFTTEQLATLRVPMQLIHCGADIAYPLDHFQEFESAVKNAGCTFSSDTIEGAAHFGPVTHGAQANRIIHDFIDRVTPTAVPPPPSNVTSPFTDRLVKAGLIPGEADSDDEFV